MKAVQMTAPGDPTVLQLSDRPQPTLQQDTDILVRLRAAGVNPIDTKLRRRGTFFPDRMPAILGCDGAGIVEAVGSAVTQVHRGDEVYFCQGGLGAQPGTYAEWAVVDARFVARKPESLTFAQAAAAPLVLITAWEALYDRARLQAGQTVLVHGGAGGVGHVAIQLAQQRGAAVCTTVSTPEKAKFVQALGVDRAILYPHEDFVQAALDWTAGVGVGVTFDTVGGELLGRSFAATQVYGDLVTILEPDAATPWKVARNRNQRISFELMLTPMLQGLVAAQCAQADILAQGARLIDSGRLRLHVAQTLPLADAAIAHQTLEAGGMTGKLVLTIDA